MSVPTPKGDQSFPEKNPEEIPKEELLHLCMKMNKRMQAMEGKGKELVRKKNILLTERAKLLELFKSFVNIPITDNDSDLDIEVIESSVLRWQQKNSSNLVELEQKLAAMESYKTDELKLTNNSSESNSSEVNSLFYF